MVKQQKKLLSNQNQCMVTNCPQCFVVYMVQFNVTEIVTNVTFKMLSSFHLLLHGQWLPLSVSSVPTPSPQSLHQFLSHYTSSSVTTPVSQLQHYSDSHNTGSSDSTLVSHSLHWCSIIQQ